MPKRRQTKRKSTSDRPITYRGRSYPVIDRKRVGRRDLLVLARLGSAGRERLQVWDTAAGATGMRLLLRVPAAAKKKSTAVSAILAASSHPSFPQVLETHRDGDDVLVLTAWVEGVTLEERMQRSRDGRLPWPSVPDAWKLYRSLCHALTTFHRATNVVHNDIRPDNLIINRRPERVVLVDFGSAWNIERATQADNGDGVSPPWSAPERLNGSSACDFRGDYFSAAAIGYQLLTGDTPYDKLGGVAGTLAPADRPRLTPASKAARRKDALPAGAWSAIDKCLAAGLALEATDRPDGPSELLQLVNHPHQLLTTSAGPRGWQRCFIDWLTG